MNKGLKSGKVQEFLEGKGLQPAEHRVYAQRQEMKGQN